MLPWAAHTVGAFIGSYVILRIVMLGFSSRKYETPYLLLAGMITLSLATVGGGYAMKDGAPDPVFFQAFVTYLTPVLLALVVELSRARRLDTA